MLVGCGELIRNIAFSSGITNFRTAACPHAAPPCGDQQVTDSGYYHDSPTNHHQPTTPSLLELYIRRPSCYGDSGALLLLVGCSVLQVLQLRSLSQHTIFLHLSTYQRACFCLMIQKYANFIDFGYLAG